MDEKVYRLKLIMNEKELTLFDILQLDLLDREDLDSFLKLLYVMEDKTQYENTIISQAIEKVTDFLYLK